jgi:hypothetical protein
MELAVLQPSGALEFCDVYYIFEKIYAPLAWSISSDGRIIGSGELDWICKEAFIIARVLSGIRTRNVT